MFRFQLKYFFFFLFLLLTEVLIAVYAHDRFIRPYFGDFLVVMLVYCFVKSFLTTPVVATAIAVLLFAYAIEVGQYFHVADALGLQQHSALRVAIGSSFEWSDIAAYTLGVLVIVLVEKKTEGSSLIFVLHLNRLSASSSHHIFRVANHRQQFFGANGLPYSVMVCSARKQGYIS